MKNYLEFITESIDDDFKNDIVKIKNELRNFNGKLSIALNELTKINSRTPEVVKELSMKSIKGSVAKEVPMAKGEEQQPPPTPPASSEKPGEEVKSKETPIISMPGYKQQQELSKTAKVSVN